MRCYRIADSRFSLFDGTGARLLGGRWNSPGRALIYAAETYSGAILEILVHANLNRLPHNHAFITIEIPDSLRISRIIAAEIPGWSEPSQSISRSFGDHWLTEQETAVLSVPSFVTHGQEQNLLINPAHPDFAQITHTPPEKIIWDQRLFSR